jgi:hypothetical protein
MWNHMTQPMLIAKPFSSSAALRLKQSLGSNNGLQIVTLSISSLPCLTYLALKTKIPFGSQRPGCIVIPWHRKAPSASGKTWLGIFLYWVLVMVMVMAEVFLD